MGRRGYARPLSGQALLAYGKPHLPYVLRYLDLQKPRKP